MSGNCRFKTECAYHHKEPKVEDVKLVQKVNELEKVLQAQNEEQIKLVKKVIELEKVVQAQNRIVLTMQKEKI